jgi:uncharacterized OB-fold protein
VAAPEAGHPLDRPFAFALITLDGADTAMVHAVDAGSEGALRAGLRVVARFRAQPKGRTDDLAFFVPEGTESADPGVVDGATRAAAASPDAEPVATMEFWSSLNYHEAVAPAGERYARSLLSGTLLGQRCPTCEKVYVPPRDFCAIDGIPLGEANDVALPDQGVITNFTIVTPVQYPGQQETEPFVRVSVLLDDVDALMGLQPVIGIPNEEVRVGMRVKAVWLPESERNADEFGNRGWGSTTGAVSGWGPTGEPDLPIERFMDRVF